MMTSSMPVLESDATPPLLDSHIPERLTLAIFEAAQDRQIITFYAGLAPYIHIASIQI
jgi:hypothetical protein